MRIRHLALATGLLLAGCAAPGAGAGSPTSFTSPDDGRRALTASVTGLADGNYRFTRVGRRTVDGTVALPGAVALGVKNLPQDGFQSASVIAVDTEHYFRYDVFDGDAEKVMAGLEAEKAPEAAQAAKQYRSWLPVLSGKQWARYDATKITNLPVPALPTPQKPDATGVTDLLTGVTSAQRTGDTVTGRLDATKVPEGLGLFGAEPVADLLGAAASSMPYSATLDPQGRLVNFTVDVPEVALSQSAAAENPTPDASADPMFPGFRLTIKIADYGQTDAPAAPAGARTLDRFMTTFFAEFD
jgi:hypothetical protein